ncbi:hypothetical protein [Sphingomonas sp.]|nr:hypothetical protein [Sphingomonas sp.]
MSETTDQSPVAGTGPKSPCFFLTGAIAGIALSGLVTFSGG